MGEHGRDESGWFSIWIGTAPDEQSLAAVVAVGYDEDGEPVWSSFRSSFQIDCFDEDLMEVFTFPSTRSVRDALLGCSDDDKVIGALAENGISVFRETENCCVLLHDFRHQADAGESHNIADVKLTFLGSFKQQ